MQGLDHLTLGGGLPQQIVLTQPGRHPVALDTGLGAHLLDRLGEQAETLTQLDVLVGKVSGCRGEIVGVDRGQGQTPIVLRLEGPAVVLLLEPQHTGSQHTTAGQVVASPGLNGAQVLTDHDGAGSVCLQEDDAEHGLMVVAHVGAAIGPHALGDPPQAEQADDVVHAQRTSVTQHRAHHVTQRGVGRTGEVLGVPRRLRPVLALLVVHVRRCAHRDAGGEGLRVGPHVRTLRVHAHGEVVHDAERHSRGQGLGLCARQLLIDDPLQPGEEVDALGQQVSLIGHVGRVRITQRSRPCIQGTVLLHQRAPQGEALQPLALLGTETLEVTLPGVGAAGGEDDLKGLMLGLPHRVPIDRLGAQVAVLDLLEGPLHQRTLGTGEPGHLRDVLRPDIERVDEAAGDGQIGRGGHRRYWLSRVQRVDEQEVGPLVPQEGGELGKVIGVTGSPGAPRTNRVELGHDAPATLPKSLGQIKMVRGDRQSRGHRDRLRLAVGRRSGVRALRRRLSGAGADLRDEPVPAQGQVGSQDEGGATTLDSVDLSGHRPVLGLGQLSDPTVLKLDAYPHLRTVGDVQGDGGLHSATSDHGGSECLAPGDVLHISQGALDLLIGAGAHTERGEHGLEGGA